MTDLQVKYQQLQHDKAVLEEDKRLHDAQIAKAQAEAKVSERQVAKVDAETQKLLAEYQVKMKDLEWYDSDKYFEHLQSGTQSFENIGSGIEKLTKAGKNIMGSFNPLHSVGNLFGF